MVVIDDSEQSLILFDAFANLKQKRNTSRSPYTTIIFTNDVFLKLAAQLQNKTRC